MKTMKTAIYTPTQSKCTENRVSEICLICGRLENDSTWVATRKNWICPECGEKLKKLIDKMDGDE